LRIAANGGSSPLTSIYPLDLATNVDYQVVVRWDNVGVLSKLWVDPVVEADASIQSADTSSALTTTSYGFPAGERKTPSLFIDDLFCGKSLR